MAKRNQYSKKEPSQDNVISIDDGRIKKMRWVFFRTMLPEDHAAFEDARHTLAIVNAMMIAKEHNPAPASARTIYYPGCSPTFGLCSRPHKRIRQATISR